MFGEMLIVVMLLFFMIGSVYYVKVDKVIEVIELLCVFYFDFVVDGEF